MSTIGNIEIKRNKYSEINTQRHSNTNFTPSLLPLNSQINKFNSNINTHTKHKLIDSLINQKLNEEKSLLKNRFVNILQK